jgi:hypothetical protein
MKRRAIGIVVGLGVCILQVAGAGTASAAASNLVKNGGFEKPVVLPGAFVPFAKGASFSHWKVVGAVGNVAVVSGTFVEGGFTFPAKTGAQWLDLTGTTSTATGVSQTVSTAAGTPYTLSFSVGNLVNPGGPYGTSSTVNVIVDGSPVFSAVNTKGAGSSAMVWKSFSVTFVVATGSTTIQLMNGDPASDTANGLDAVKLSSAP